MLLVYGTAAWVLAMLFFGVTLIGARNPRSPAWANDFWVANIYVPMMIGLAVIGVGATAKFFISLDRQPLDVNTLVLSAGVAAVGLVLLKLLRIKQRLADFAARPVSAAGQAVEPTPLVQGGPDTSPPLVEAKSGDLAA